MHETSVVLANVEFEGDYFVGPYCTFGQPGFQHAEWGPAQFRAVGDRVGIGDGARILGHSVICVGTEIGADLRCDYHTFIGEHCKLGERVVVEYGARIYDRAVIGAGTTISGFVCNKAQVGSGCVVQGSLVHRRTSPPPEAAPTIEDNCLIGQGAVVIGEVRLGEGTIVGAGAIVTSDTEPGYLYTGAPARRVRLLKWY